MLLHGLRKRIAKALAGSSKIIIWGAGSGGRQALKLLPRRSVSYFVDAYSSADSVEGLPVRRPHYLQEEAPDALVVIASVAAREILEVVAELGLQQRVMLFDDLVLAKMDSDSEIDRLAMDLVAAHEISWVETFLRKPQTVLNISYRLCRYLEQRRWRLLRPLFFIARCWHSLNCAFFGIDLPIGVEAGGGLLFVHPGGIVLHERVKLGHFVAIYQCVTVGSGRRGDVPSIGNHVILWSSAVLVGGCRIGDNSEVGANSLCLRDLQVENGIVAGNPASRLK